MAASTDTRPPEQLGDAIVSFALEGQFPDEDVSSLSLSTADLSLAVDALGEAKSQLEVQGDQMDKPKYCMESQFNV